MACANSTSGVHLSTDYISSEQHNPRSKDFLTNVELEGNRKKQHNIRVQSEPSRGIGSMDQIASGVNRAA